MQHVVVPFIDVARQEDVHRLALTDIGRAVGGKLDHPALVQFERADNMTDRLAALKCLVNRCKSMQRHVSPINPADLAAIEFQCVQPTSCVTVSILKPILA